MTSLLLVHGAWHSGKGFASLITELEKLNIKAKAIELSSVAQKGEPIGDMYKDAEIVRREVSKLDNCVVLGHSYGGLPITQGLVGLRNVQKLIYLTAFMLDEGETLYAACGSQDPAWWVRTPDNLRLTTENPGEIFYNTCDKATADSAIAMLREQSLEAFNQPITKLSWKEINSTYIICEKDNAIPVFAQEAMSQRANCVVRLNTDHSPFLSDPKGLAKTISEII